MDKHCEKMRYHQKLKKNNSECMNKNLKKNILFSNSYESVRARSRSRSRERNKRKKKQDIDVYHYHRKRNIAILKGDINEAKLTLDIIHKPFIKSQLKNEIGGKLFKNKIKNKNITFNDILKYFQLYKVAKRLIKLNKRYKIDLWYGNKYSYEYKVWIFDENIKKLNIKSPLYYYCSKNCWYDAVIMLERTLMIERYAKK